MLTRKVIYLLAHLLGTLIIVWVLTPLTATLNMWFGTYTFASGSKYVGEFKDGKYNGQGTATFASGEKYVGEWKDGKFNGQGTLFASNGSIINQGIFADNKFIPAHRD